MGSSKDPSRHGSQPPFGRQNDDSEEEVQSIDSSTGTRSVSASSESHIKSDANLSVSEHRNMMLASLLEDHFRTRAAEFLNAANPGLQYTRQSPEVQPLAQELFAQASRTLSSNGLLSTTAASDQYSSVRTQYLSGVDSLAAGNPAPGVSLLEPIHKLVGQVSKLAVVPNPANDQQIILRQPHARSHYSANFHEITLLGKGGFGRVYRCHNSLDNRTYAVKKIPLSAKLGRKLCQGGHEELQHILREVQALARLDHPNIVRYHHTWLEEPQAHVGADEDGKVFVLFSVLLLYYPSACLNPVTLCTVATTSFSFC
jgi:eukaryotic translation initiation factor 2-alpha kinase 3